MTKTTKKPAAPAKTPASKPAAKPPTALTTDPAVLAVAELATPPEALNEAAQPAEPDPVIGIFSIDAARELPEHAGKLPLFESDNPRHIHAFSKEGRTMQVAVLAGKLVAVQLDA